MLVYALVMHMNTESKLIFAFFTFLDLKISTLFIYFIVNLLLNGIIDLVLLYIFLRRESYTYVHFI